ncbi:hypothetical protein GN956_G14291 [Arapaima gigas]
MAKLSALLCVLALVLTVTSAAPRSVRSADDPVNCRWCAVLLDVKPDDTTVKPQAEQVQEIQPDNSAMEQQATWSNLS